MRGSPARILVALVVALGVGVGLWRPWQDGPRFAPDELASAALNAPTVTEQTVAAVKLADGGQASLAPLRRVLVETTEPDVKAICLEGLAALWDYESMDLFLDLADTGPPLVRGRAAQVIMRLTGRQRPYLSSAPEAERRTIVQHMRADWHDIQNAPAQARDELKRRLRESHDKKL